MITIEHVEELIRNSRSSYFFRHSCATDADKQELAQKILDEIVIPLTNIARKTDASVLTKPKYDGVQVELPFAKSGTYDVNYRFPEEDYQ